MGKHRKKYQRERGAVHKRKNWKSASKAFATCNDHCTYLVLRNFENFYEELLLEGHNDIDVLCKSSKDRRKMVSVLGAVPRLSRDNGIHYRFFCQGKELDLDIRCVGDGYYDQRWQKAMLENRVYDERGFFRMDEDDYFYSLLYHGLYQKEALSEEYFQRLKRMNGPILWLDRVKTAAYTEKQKQEQILYLWEEALRTFMTERGYRYTRTKDLYINLHFPQDEGVCIQYPFWIRIQHLIKRSGGYVTGKFNGARVRLFRIGRRRRAGAVRKKRMRQMKYITDKAVNRNRVSLPGQSK